jgi:hypothetical protein
LYTAFDFSSNPNNPNQENQENKERGGGSGGERSSPDAVLLDGDGGEEKRGGRRRGGDGKGGRLHRRSFMHQCVDATEGLWRRQKLGSSIPPWSPRGGGGGGGGGGGEGVGGGGGGGGEGDGWRSEGWERYAGEERREGWGNEMEKGGNACTPSHVSHLSHEAPLVVKLKILSLACRASAGVVFSQEDMVCFLYCVFVCMMCVRGDCVSVIVLSLMI